MFARIKMSYKESARIILLCFGWYIASSANGVVGKIILNEFPYPMTVSMIQLASITICLIPILWWWNIPSAKSSHISLKYWVQMILPLAFGKFFSSVSSHISIWKVPVSYSQTVKSTMPFFAVLMSRIVLKETQTSKVYLSLIPIVLGVGVASVTELSFDLLGFLCALISTFGFATLNIYSKKCLKETGLHHIRLLFMVTSLSAVMFSPLWAVYDLTSILHDTTLSFRRDSGRLLLLLLADGLCNFAQNLIAFTVIALLSPLSYAVANCTKRIAVISVSILFLRNPVTVPNSLGMVTAILGVLFYNRTLLFGNERLDNCNTKLTDLEDKEENWCQDNGDSTSTV